MFWRRWTHQFEQVKQFASRLSRQRGIRDAVLVSQSWRSHRSGRHVTLIGYFSFVSVFPLLLVFASVSALLTSVWGWDLDRINESVVSQIPLVGDEVIHQAGSVSGSVATIVMGGLVALWAGTKAFMKIFDMNDDLWDIPPDDRDNFARRRLRCLTGLGVVGIRVVVATAATTVVTVIPLPLLGEMVAVIVGVVVNVTVMAGLLRLSSRPQTWRSLAPGAVVGGVLFWMLQVFGTTIVSVSAGAGQGPFAPTFALIAWMMLHATVITGMAELNATVERQRSGTSVGPAPTH